MFIDTHCHLNMLVKNEFDRPMSKDELIALKKVLSEAQNSYVTTIINIGTSLVESINSVEIAKRYDSVFASVGIHPTDCKEDWKKDFEEIRKLVSHHRENNIVAIGETGLDYFHKPFDKQRQTDAFKAHIELALENDLPLVLHVRDAADDVLKVLEEYKGQATGVNHCFVHEEYFAKQMIEWGYYLGIGAVFTYPKNDKLRETLKRLPLEKFVLETDAPFLPPQNMRGKQNHPKYIPDFARELANLKGVTLLDLAAISSTNAKFLFKLP